jgi:hypothetical protein
MTRDRTGDAAGRSTGGAGTLFLVYSRGTGSDWDAEEFRAAWVERLGGGNLPVRTIVRNGTRTAPRAPGEREARVGLVRNPVTLSPAATLALCGLLGLPLCGLAETPVAEDVARAHPAHSTTSAVAARGRDSAPAADEWDGLISLVLEYLDLAGAPEATVVQVEGTLPTPAT